MSAYSAEMLEACNTVTLKVKVLPIFRWDRAFSGERSRGRSRPDRPKLFMGLQGASWVATRERGQHRHRCLIMKLIFSSNVSTYFYYSSTHYNSVLCLYRRTNTDDFHGGIICRLVSSPCTGLLSPAQVLLLTSSAEIPMSAFCPSPSTIRSSSCEVLECDRPPGHDSVWN